MKRKVISMLLVLCMVCGMLPSSLVATVEAASTTDAFGVRLEGDLTKEEVAAAKASNPYGTENWFNLFPISELYIAYGDTDKQNMKSYDYNPNFDASWADSPEDRVGSIGSVDSSGSQIGGKTTTDFPEYNVYTLMDTAACDINGDGQGRYVANLAFNRYSQQIELFLTDKYGNVISERETFGTKATLGYLKEVLAFYNNGYLSVACGDFDGDGKDSIVAYVPYMEDGAAQVHHIKIDGANGNYTLTVESSKNIYDATGYEDISDKTDDYGDIARNVPLVQLLAEDVDKDGIDEVVMTSSRSDAQDVAGRGSLLSIFDYVKDGNENYSFHTSANMALSPGSTESEGRLRWASSSVGNVISNTSALDFPEIVSAGFYDYKSGKDSGIKTGIESQGNMAAYMTACSAVNVDHYGNQIGTYTMSVKNLKIEGSEFVRGGFDDGFQKQSLVAVQAFSAHGIGQPDSVLVGDTVYAYDGGALTLEYRHEFFNDDEQAIGWAIVSKCVVQDVVAGNFDGNNEGVEQVVFSTMQKQQDHNNYYTKLYTYQDKNGWKMDETGFFTDRIGTAYLSLTAFDCDGDGTLARIKDVERSYTEPEVLAVLEAVPYFSEVDDGDINNGATSYETLNSSGTADANSNSLTTNIVAGFEWGVDDVTGGFTCGVEFETTIENNFTWSTETEKYESYSLAYDNDTGENMVIVYRRPVISYLYERKGSDKEIVIAKEGTLATSMISVDAYNEAAAQYGIGTISDSLLGTPGDPFSYRTVAPEGATFKDEQYQQYYSPTGGTLSQSFTTGQGETKDFEYELATSFTACGKVMGIKAGGGAGYNHTTSSSTMNTSEITKTGTVSCNSTEGYDFQWRFGHWDTEINDNIVPVLGYVISDPTLPKTFCLPPM